jgi:protein-L-isoaspartate(D-aspartate) O-methyltransferase
MSKLDKDVQDAKRVLLKSLDRNINAKHVLKVMATVPRELFVPPESHYMAYHDLPINIGHGQTISQPYIVALMTAALDLKGSERVLEVGTGSGYQSAILSMLTPNGHVLTVERLPILADRARILLLGLGYRNVKVGLAGLTLGSQENSPFDAIIVTAAAPQLPASLIHQLNVGGRLVIPIGTRDKQELYQVFRLKSGVSVRQLGPCRFVPLIGREAFPET